jgi:hypothetical protein
LRVKLSIIPAAFSAQSFHKNLDLSKQILSVKLNKFLLAFANTQPKRWGVSIGKKIK